MRKIASVLILVFAFTLTSQAQKRKKRMPKDPLTVEQQATLTVKKMALALDLTDAQQRKIKPVITKQITERRAQMEKMKKLREERKKLEAEQRFKRQNEALDSRIAFQEDMKSILNSDQYEKFKKMAHKRGRKVKERMAKRRKMQWLKEKRESEDDDN